MFRGSRPQRVVAAVAIVVGVATITVDLIGVSQGAWPLSTRVLVAVVSGGTAIGVLLGIMRIEHHLLANAVVLGAAGLLGAAGSAAPFDSTTTLSLIVLMGVIYVAIRDRHGTASMVAYIAGTSAYTVALLVVDRADFAMTMGRLLIGIPIQATVLLLLHRLIGRAERARAEAERREVIERAMATCSEALLIQSSEDSIRTAVRALLDATPAEYAYVDVNTIGPNGERRWAIVADAAEEGAFAGPDEFDSGGYEDLPWLEARLERGEPVTVDVQSLSPSPTKNQYVAEGVESELIAPVLIDGVWSGSIGFAANDRTTWAQVEVDAAVRAAQMIGAYWARQRAREGLLALNEARSRFVASVSHELRTPMTAVLGFSAELAAGIDAFSSEEISSMAAIIHRQSGDVKSLIDDLLVLERSNVGDITIQPERVRVLPHIEEMISGSDRMVEVDCEDIEVWTDPLRFRQILRNLLSNASRHGGPKIRLSVTATSHHAEIVVCDNGPGVGALDGDRIFDEFVRGVGEATRPDSVGLGLAVARRLARLCGGDLSHSRRDGWTEFTLTATLAKPEHARTVAG